MTGYRRRDTLLSEVRWSQEEEEGGEGGGGGGGGGGRGGGGGGGIIFDLDTTVMCYVIPNGSLWKSSNFQFLGVMGGFKVSPLVL